MRDRDWLEYQYPFPVKAMRGQNHGEVIKGTLYEAFGAELFNFDGGSTVYLKIRDESGRRKAYLACDFQLPTASAIDEHYANDPLQGRFG